MADIETRIQALLPELTRLRHDLHRHPELGYEEHETAARVVAELADLPGMRLRTGVAGTGVVATLGGDRPGPCVALRADMDALRLEEQGEHEHRSRVPGTMHACGHDGHVACLVGAARVLADVADELAGPVKLVFQPAEEGGAGAQRMCEEGVLDDPPVAAIFGFHGWPWLTQGEVGLWTGAAMASTDRLRIAVRGVGAHAAFPHQGVDTVLVAAHVIVALQSITARNTDPLDSVVVTVAQVHGGTTDNIIPEEVVLTGTVRALGPQTRQHTLERIEAVAVSTARAFGADAKVVIDAGYPAVENHAAALDYVRRVAQGGRRVVDIDPVMGGEDFAYYGQRVPAAFYALGVRPVDRGNYPTLHQPDYDFHDGAIADGVGMHVEIARRFGSEGPQASRAGAA